MASRIDIGLLLLRLTFGGLMLVQHGWGKMLRFFSDESIKFADPIGIGMRPTLGLAAFAEVLCAALIIVGLFTRWATLPLIVTMLVAIFIIHAGDPLGDLELAIVYLIPYVVLYLTGPGKYSLDAQMKKSISA